MGRVIRLHRTRHTPLTHRDTPAVVVIVCLILIGLAWIAWLAGGADQ